MKEKETILNQISRDYALPIWLTSHKKPLLPDHIRDELNKPVRKGFFFIQLVLKGIVEHRLDWKSVFTSDGQVLFITPELIHTLPSFDFEAEFYKISFASEIMSYFPAVFNFFVNPFNTNVIDLDKNARERMELLFRLLFNAVEDKTTGTEVVLSHLYALLTECNSAYFKNSEDISKAGENLSLFMRFKKYIEDTFLEQPSVEQIATDLGINSNSLYSVVKKRTGISPKEFLTERLILEAKRKLYFEDISIKELAYYLNYNDPEYFSRLFRKYEGKTIREYRNYIQDLSGL